MKKLFMISFIFSASIAISLAQIKVLTNGTDTHQVIIDVTPLGLNGLIAQKALEECGIITNRNMLPFDRLSPYLTSGVRFGTSASTAFGLNRDDHLRIANLICEILILSSSPNSKMIKLKKDKKII